MLQHLSDLDEPRICRAKLGQRVLGKRAKRCVSLVEPESICFVAHEVPESVAEFSAMRWRCYGTLATSLVKLDFGEHTGGRDKLAWVHPKEGIECTPVRGHMEHMHLIEIDSGRVVPVESASADKGEAARRPEPGAMAATVDVG